ncbi:MAG: insulinase family protein [Desulfobacteraceae bacterium]|nr:insulinase family protein [Desulfobacteraceae bacterium]
MQQSPAAYFRQNFYRAVKEKSYFIIWLFLSLLALSVLTHCAPLQERSNYKKPFIIANSKAWTHEQSDLEHDSSWLYGRFSNGVRYVLKENKTPKDRVSMHLLVNAGSLCETDDEKGMAHFLEHMMFNGSKNFEPGEMVKFFQRIGMQFGPDANAHTGFNRTVYDVILPKGDAKSISEGLMVLRDYAQGALLQADELEKERRVVLSEKRSRDSARFRILKSTLGFEMPDTLAADRLPIGEEEILHKIDNVKMRRFYDFWYRPERFIIIIVGDFKTREVLPIMKEEFAGIAPRAKARELSDFGDINHNGLKTFYHFESEAGSTKVTIETIENVVEPLHTADRQKELLKISLAERIINHRLHRYIQQSESVLTSGRSNSGFFLRQVKYTEISGRCKPDKWKESLGVLEQTLRQALEYGFLESELELVKNDCLAELQGDARESKTRNSSSLARWAINSLSGARVIQDPEHILESLKPVVDQISLQQINQAFRHRWKASHRLVLVTGNVDLKGKNITPADQILAAFHDSSQVAAVAPVKKKKPVFPYLAFPENFAGIAKRESLHEGAEKIVFNNGFTLFLKHTKYKHNQIMAALSFGEGKSSEPEDRPGLAELTKSVVNLSGFGALNRFELEEALSGKLARIKLDVRENLFTVKGKTITAELPVLLQLIYTFIHDPGYRQQGLNLSLDRFEQYYCKMNSKIEGVMKLKGERHFAGGDSRFGMPSWRQFKQYRLEDVTSWFHQQLTQSPLELAIVGDFNSENVIEQVSRYFGNIKSRKKHDYVQKRSNPVFPEADSLTLKADSQLPKSLVVIGYPTDDFRDINRTRRLNVLAEVITDRLREQIRENLGAAYSPHAYNRSYRCYPGYGIFKIYLNVDPTLAESLIDEVYRIASDVVEQGISEDEFRRAIDPTITRIKDLRQTNGYWLNSVLTGAGQYPQQLEWCRTIEKDYASINVDQIMTLARTYLNNKKASSIIIYSGDSNDNSSCVTGGP